MRTTLKAYLGSLEDIDKAVPLHQHVLTPQQGLERLPACITGVAPSEASGSTAAPVKCPLQLA